MKLSASIFAVAAALTVPAAAGADSRAQLELSFASPEPGSVTAVTVAVSYRGADPNGKPSPIRAGVIEAPAGTRFGGGAAIPACTASDDELRSRGRAACPAASRLGGGTLTAITGFGPPADPFEADLTVFKTPTGFIEVVHQRGGEAVLGMDRPTIEGSRITLHPPSTPGGPPDGQTAVRDIRFVIAANGFVVTPPDCPPDGLWRSRSQFTFADGYVAPAQATTPCRRGAVPGGGARPPRLALAVTPARARTGRATTYRFRVSGRRGCRAGVTVRFAGRQVRTGATGRAVLRLHAARPGIRTARAAKAGCGRAIARVRILAP